MTDRAVSRYIVQAVAVEARAHFQRLTFFRFHYVGIPDVAVTYCTGLGNIQPSRNLVAIDVEPGGFHFIVSEEPYVSLMDEPHVVRHAVYPLPVDRRAFREALAYLGYLGSRGFILPYDVFMAEQTHLYRRNRGGFTLGYIPMAELTLNVVLGHVNGVREGNRLR